MSAATLTESLGLDSSLTGELNDWLESACLGGAITAEVAEDLQRAAAAYHLDGVAEGYLLQAYARAPEHPAVHIALYRFYFYKNRLSEALEVAQRCLVKTAMDLNLPQDWQAVTPQHADFSTYAAAPRFYLFTLKGCAYLHMRLGEMDTGAAMVDKLTMLDPADRLGGSVLRGVLERMGQDDDD